VNIHADATAFATGVRDSMVSDTIKNVTTGAIFTAEVEGNLDPFTMPTGLVDDPREKVRLHVTDPAVAMNLKWKQEITFNYQGRNCKFVIVAGMYEPSQPQSKFYAAQIL